MNKRELLIREIEEAPDPLVDEIQEVLDRLRKASPGEGRRTALASEAALAEDWLRSEEDEAWRDL